MAIRNVISPGDALDIRANFLTQLSASSDGDTIVFPNGSFIMSNITTVNKTVTIKGGGIGVTTLYRDEAVADATLEGWSDMFYCTSPASFEDLTLKSKTPSVDDTGADGFSIAIDRGIEYEYDTFDWTVRNCRFENFGHSGVFVLHRDDEARGLITECEFYHNYKGIDGLGYGYGITVFGEGVTWVNDPQLGSSNFIFIENNTFELHRHSVASAGGGLLVVRHNTFLNNIAGGNHAIDSHSGRGPGNGLNSIGTRAMEIYGNTITNTLFKDGTTLVSGSTMSNVSVNAIACRAGDMVAYNNVISGFRFGIGLGMWDITPTGAYPWHSQPGYNSGDIYGDEHTGNVGFTIDGSTGSYMIKYGDGDLYYWDNTFTPYVSSPVMSTSEFYNYDPTDGATHYFVAERDFHSIRKPNYKPYIYPHP